MEEIKARKLTEITMDILKLADGNTILALGYCEMAKHAITANADPVLRDAHVDHAVKRKIREKDK